MKPGAINHPKVEELADVLGIRIREARGILEALFHFTNQYAPRGDIGRFQDQQIAKRVDWGGEGEEPGRLIEALLQVGWLERHGAHRLVIHDWSEHAPDYTKRKIAPKDESGEGWAVEDPEPTVSAVNSTNPDDSGNPQKNMDPLSSPFPSSPFPPNPTQPPCPGAHAPDHDSPPRGDSPSPPEARQVGEAGSGGERSAPRARGSRLPPPEAFERVDSLASAILASVPGHRVPKTDAERERSAIELARLHRLDRQPWELIDEVIAWLPTHEGSNGFAWGRVVLSARKFRERFPQLVAQMRAPPAKERLSFEEQHRRELERFDQRCKRGEHESDAQAD